MNGPVRATSVCLLLALMTSPAPAFADDKGDTGAHTTEHQLHKNHTGSFVGASTHLDTEETGATLGIEYARVFSSRWGVAGYVEMVSSSAERDYIFIVGLLFYPWRGLGLVVGPGIERAETEVEHHGEVTTEKEMELILRFGGGYGWSITPDASLGPVVFADVVKDRWTIVYGLGLTVGF